MIDKDTLARLKAAHGERLAVLTAGEHMCVFRRLSRAEYQMHKKMARDEASRHLATEQLATAQLVHPEREQFDALLAREPALADTFGAKLLELAGVGRADLAPIEPATT